MWFCKTLMLTLLGLVVASPGDDLFIFDDCKFQCEQITCYHNHYYIHKLIDYQNDNTHLHYGGEPYHPEWQFQKMPLPYHLRLLGWDCESNCDYQCQRIVTKVRLDENFEVLQFHGKWPFKRLLGAQELASVIFSIGNFIPHYQGFKKIVGAMRNSPQRKAQYVNILCLSIITMCAWVASAVFHYRDTNLTETIDYFLAGATVLSGFHAVVQRLFKLYLPHKRTTSVLFTLGCLIAYSGHIAKLILDWSYTYNMQANIIVGVLQNVCWCFLCFQLYSKYYELESSKNEAEQRHNHLSYINFKRIILPSFYAHSPKLYSLYPLALTLIVLLGMSMEILDFPPLFDLIDAHAIWHLATIFPATFGLYDWLIWDTNENVIPEVQKDLEIKQR